MPSPLVPVLLLLVLPALLFASRCGLFQHRTLRWGGGVALAGAVVASLPWEGIDLVQVKRINLLLAAAVVALLLLRHLGVAWTRRQPVWRGTLLVVTTLAGLNYLNYFSFHGERTWIHLHDVAHYYLGAKYHAELGYTDLYTAMLRAEAELYDNHFKGIEARDLETNELVHIRELLVRSDAVKERFDPRRWVAFSTDVDFLRQSLGPLYPKVLQDHGFNPSPVWTLVGGFLANRVPAGSYTGVLLLTLLDPLLLLLLFAAVGRVFGGETLLLSLLLFCLVFGANFGWTGGAFLRYLWLACLVVGACCLERRRHTLAGALFAASTLLRIFPLFFVVPLLVGATVDSLRERRLARRHVRLVASYAGTGLLLVATTLLLPNPIGHWLDFRANTQRQVETISPNVVGLTQVLAYRSGPETISREEFRERRERRARIHRWQLVTVLPLALLVALALAYGRRLDTLRLLAFGLPLLLVGLNLAAYYFVFLVLLVVAWREETDMLALVFGAELASHLLLLFEEREAILFIYRTLVLICLAAALYLDPLRASLRSLRPSVVSSEAETAQQQQGDDW